MSPVPMFIARHAETVFNRARRMQGNENHTPLTRAGIAQAEAMGAALAAHATASGEAPRIWTSSAGRAQQTAAIIAEHLEVPFFEVRSDARLREIEVGRWVGRFYADIIAEEGEIMDAEHRLFRMPVVDGEHYRDIAHRLTDWLAELERDVPVLVISHGITARVLRGMLVGGREYEGVAIAADVPQGSIMRVAGRQETMLVRGEGHMGVRAV